MGKPLGKSQVEYHFVGCHKEENYSKGMGVPCTPQKPEGAAARTTQVAQKLEKTSKTQKNRMLAFFHSFPSRVLCVEMKGISEKKVGKPLGKSPVECHFVGFPKEKHNSRGIGDALHSSKTRGGSCQNHPTRPEAGKNVKNPEKTECLPFSTHSHQGFSGRK